MVLYQRWRTLSQSYPNYHGEHQKILHWIVGAPKFATKRHGMDGMDVKTLVPLVPFLFPK